MNLYKVIKFIYNHPFNKGSRLDGIIRFLKWQLNCKLNSFPVIYQLTENSKIIVWKGLTGATGNIYCGLMEFNDMGFLLHFLQEDDLFVDIGANVGAYSILASAEKRAETISIEPIPSTYQYLCDNISINHLEKKVNCLNIGLGSKQEKLFFTKSLDTTNHVAKKEDKDVIEVKVESLDNLLLSNSSKPSLLKIDVEGFESEVLKGAHNTLQNNSLKALIIELNGSGKQFGYEDDEIHQSLLKYGFKPFDYDPINRKLIELSTYGENNTLYLRDINFINARINNSRKILIGGKLKI